MFLHESMVTRERSFRNSRTNEVWVMREGVSVGVDSLQVIGRKTGDYKEQIIPVIRHPDKPADSWGIVESQKGRAKIENGQQSIPGIFLRLSSYREGGKAVGDVYVSIETAGRVELLAHGIGGKPQLGTSCHEYIVACYGPTEFFVIGSREPDERWLYDGEEVTVYQDALGRLDSYVSLKSSQIRQWVGRVSEVKNGLVSSLS